MRAAPDMQALPPIPEMTAAEFRGALADLGLSNAEAEAWLDASHTTISGWASGSRPIPSSVALIVRMGRQEPCRIAKMREIGATVGSSAPPRGRGRPARRDAAGGQS